MTEDGKTVTGKKFSLVKSGVIFQNMCRNGLKYDIAISWLQKAIRRGLTDEALYCAYHIHDLGKIFSSHLLNRLLTIMSEDVGVAQPGIAETIVPLYQKCKNNYEDPETPGRIVLMVETLALAAKSRLNDWVICYLEKHMKQIDPNTEFQVLPEDPEDLCYIITQLCLHRKGVTEKLDRIWGLLTADSTESEEIEALRKAFKMRGPKYGVLHMIHAVFLSYGITGTSPEILRTEASKTWEEVSRLDFPVLPDAIDKHTQWGKRYLGRDIRDFIHNGATLAPHTPTYREEFYRYNCLPPREIQPDIHPKPYQEEMIENAKEFYKTKKSGWLAMACGTGKTFTSYWIMRSATSAGTAPVIFVAPILELVRQAFKSWTRLNRQYNRPCISAICCSTESINEQLDKYSMNEVIYPNKLKHFPCNMIFTTYKSLDSVLAQIPSPEMVVFDEAHHYRGANAPAGYKRLFLSATPPDISSEFLIGKYDTHDAIEDKNLAGYEIIRMNKEEPDEPKIGRIVNENKKTIVFSRTNGISYDLMVMSRPHIPEDVFVGYITHQTSKKERLAIFDSFRYSERAILFNCSILSEGVDFPECSAVFIQSGVSSQRRFTQAVGRAIRLDSGNPDKVGKIYRNVKGKGTGCPLRPLRRERRSLKGL